MSLSALPFDLVCSIIDRIADANDRLALTQIALVNHDCSAYANRFLWKEVSLTSARRNGIMTPVSLRDRCIAIVRDKQRAGCIRHLTMSFKYDFDTFMSMAIDGSSVDSASGLDGLLAPISDKTERGIEHLFDIVAAAIAACSDRLESLSIFGPCHLSDIGHALSRLIDRPPIDLTKTFLFSSPPPITHPTIGNLNKLRFPHLRKFSSMLSAAHGVMPFLVSACTEVQHWAISGLRANQCMEGIPPDLFPSLKKFEGLAKNLIDVTRGRSVWNISIIGTIDTQQYSAVRGLLEGLQASAVPVLELSINVAITGRMHGEMDDALLLRDIAIAAPSLRSLEMFSHGKYTTHDYREEARDAFAQNLAVFEKLEEFYWWDGRGERWGAAFPHQCFECSEKLQRVFVNKSRYDKPKFNSSSDGLPESGEAN